MPKYHYIVKIQSASSPLSTGDKVDFSSIHSGKSGWVSWNKPAHMTGWLPGTGTPQVGDTIGITLTPEHAASLGLDASGDVKTPDFLPGCFVYDAHALRLDAVTVWLQHPQAGTHAFALGEGVELAHARPVEGVRARARFSAERAAAFGAAADEPWTVVWRTAVGRVRTAAGWSAPRTLVPGAHLDGPASAPARPGEVGWANVHHAVGFGPGA
ncbi:MAG: hypothetical protein H6702_04680 [Myxococcales bacterium]|nr:hypothetical protein [Myxococcales bacterium]